jgi:hypothetical protein
MLCGRFAGSYWEPVVLPFSSVEEVMLPVAS